LLIGYLQEKERRIMHNDEHASPGAYIFRVALRPSGRDIDVRADRAEIGVSDDKGHCLLALWVDTPTVASNLYRETHRVFSAPPGTWSLYVRLDTLVTAQSAPAETAATSTKPTKTAGPSDAVYRSAAKEEH
jgi:hypothetical protein